MTGRWSLRSVLGAVVLLGLAVAPWTTPLAAQSDGVDTTCAGEPAGISGECYLAAGAVRLIQPRVGVALFGGSPTPGSASTLGMRLGSLPRVSFSGRVVALPMELPPLPDRSAGSSSEIRVGFSGQAAVGIFSGLSPLPTVGGVLSLDGIARASVLLLPESHGFQDGAVWGGSVGLRVGLLRESFTLPGLSVTGAYGLTTSVAYGATDGTDDGFISGRVSSLGVTAAATKRIGPVGFTAGGAVDRYGSDVDFSYAGAPATPRTADARTTRWSAFTNLSWTLLIFHASLEAGWQESPVPANLPADVDVDPAGWWGGLAFRMSI